MPGKAERVTKALTSMPWAITEDYLRLMIEISLRQNLAPEQVEAQRGEKLQNTYAVEVRNGVAIIPVRGPIARYMNLFSEISGGTSIQALARDFNQALKNSDVRAILLNIDSPGGEANGINEFAEMVYQARATKPITAYIGGMGCSAAYWIASAAGEIVADASALIGSIGTLAAMPMPDSNELVFVSSQSPRKHPDITTEDGKADILAILDAMTDVFVGAVARNRGVEPSVVLSDFGQGGILVGQAAVDAGMADRLGAFEATLAGMGQKNGQAAPAPTARTPDALRLTLTVPPISAGGLASGTSAPTAARRDTSAIPQRRSTPTMDDEQTPIEQPTNGHAPPALPPINDTVMQAQISAYVTQMEARYQAQQEAAFQRAQQEFERRIADMEQRRQIEAFAQDATTATLRRQHALSCSADDLTALLMETPTGVRGKWQALLTRTLETGFVDFSEVGSEGGAQEERDIAQEWQAAVQKRRDAGMNQSTAIEAVKREQPDLFRAYNASGATVSRKGGR
jgi:capsid assembly protease